VIVSAVAERHEPYLTAHDAFAARAAGSPRWLRERRARARDRFAAVGFPTTRQEAWRFTNVAPIAEGDFRPSEAPPAGAADLVRRVAVDGAVRLVIANGRFAAALSDLRHLPKGLRLASLRDGVRDETDGIEPNLGAVCDTASHPFAALNTAFLDDGVFLSIAPGARLDVPVHVIVVTGDGAASSLPALKPSGPLSLPRVLILAGDSSDAQIAQTFVGPDGEVYFTSAVTEVIVGRGARMRLYTDQRESARAFHVLNLQVQVGAGAAFESHAFALGARLMRHDIGVALLGEGADCTMNGVYLADADRLMDTHTSLDHAVPNCTSHELYKGILAGRARGVFNGRILVRPDAQKTDARQTNRALLLTEEAQVNSNPQLEIFADDVKCTHGAAVGQLDDEALFYLRARGLTFAEARDMLLHAFASEVLDGFGIEAMKATLGSAMFAALDRDVQALKPSGPQALGEA
jgi:Fe-S cluster assembly protein SufD